MRQTQICKFQDHNKAVHICTYEHCDIESRWNCAECFRNFIHLHQLKDYRHVLSKEELKIKLKQEIQNHNSPSAQNYEQALGEVIKSIENLENLLSDFKNQIKQLQKGTNMITNYQQLLRKFIAELDKDPMQFNQQQMNMILSHKQQFDITKELKQLLVYIQLINYYGRGVENQLNKMQNQKDQSQISERNYQTKLIDQFESDSDSDSKSNSKPKSKQTQKSKKSKQKLIQESKSESQSESKCKFYGCHISNNQQYLAYGGSDEYLKIYNLSSSQQEMKIKLSGFCMCCSFTDDSKYLFVGSSNGYIYQFDTINNFKLIINSQIHTSHIYCIIPVNNNEIITCSSDKTIFRKNLNTGENQVYRGLHDYVFTIQFIKEQNIIVSGSADKSIKFWNCQNLVQIINKDQAHNSHIIQMQLIKQQEYLLSLDDGGNIIEWKFDLKQRTIVKVKQFQDQQIYNFYSVNNDSNLLAISEQAVKILDMDGNLIKLIQHQAGPNTSSLELKQLDNIDYIVIRSSKKIVIAFQVN